MTTYIVNLCGYLSCAFAVEVKLKISLLYHIGGAFLQNELNEHDWDCLRFFVDNDLNRGINDENLVIYRFKRVPFDVTSTPVLLATSIERHLCESKVPLAATILTNLYADIVLIPA